MNPDRPQISIEELLRLKRAERPPEDFWARFDAELRAKQLAALVEKPSWAEALRARFARLALPLGAAAACVMGATVWVQTRPTPAAVVAAATSPAAPIAAPVASGPVAQLPVVTEPEPPALVVSAPAPAAAMPEPAPVLSPAPAVAATPAVASVMAAPFTGGTVVELPPVNESTFAAVVMPTSAPSFAAELALAETSPLLAAYTAPVPDPFAAASAGFVRPLSDVRVGEKVSRNLDNERLYAAGRRVVALDEGRVSVKFW
jgi:hypothetical protein